MPWQVRYDDANRVVQVEYAGEITPAELGEGLRAAVRAAAEHDNGRLLTDCTRMLDGHSAFDLYALLEVVGASGMTSRYHEAVLLPGAPQAAENVRFWETACRNRGLDVRIFEDRDQALAWLHSL